MVVGPKSLTRSLLVGLIALAVAAPGLRAAETVPPEVQAAILTKMLSYDRAMKVRVGNVVVVGILAKSEDRSSAGAQAEVAKGITVLQSGRVPGLPLAVVTAAYKSAPDLTAWIAEKNIQVLY